MLLLGVTCVWAEVVAVMVSGMGQLTWTGGPVWDREGMGEWDCEQIPPHSRYPVGTGLRA